MWAKRQMVPTSVASGRHSILSVPVNLICADKRWVEEKLRDAMTKVLLQTTLVSMSSLTFLTGEGESLGIIARRAVLCKLGIVCICLCILNGLYRLLCNWCSGAAVPESICVFFRYNYSKCTLRVIATVGIEYCVIQIKFFSHINRNLQVNRHSLYNHI